MTKVSLNLPEEDVEVLRQLAEKRKTTLTQVLRRAIASENYFDEEVAKGAKILLEKDDRLREVVFRP
jgi:predicted transcriptional regulator